MSDKVKSEEIDCYEREVFINESNESSDNESEDHFKGKTFLFVSEEQMENIILNLDFSHSLNYLIDYLNSEPSLDSNSCERTSALNSSEKVEQTVETQFHCDSEEESDLQIIEINE